MYVFSCDLCVTEGKVAAWPVIVDPENAPVERLCPLHGQPMVLVEVL